MTSYKQPLVRISGGNRLITTSLAISHNFNKKHKEILRAIEKLECSKEFGERNFTLSSYTTNQNKRLPMYEITKDGFMFLCMGFTGKAAAQWKERYIVAFNTLEQTLHDNRANLAHLQTELLKSRPLWKSIKRYKQLGLNHVEIGRLMERADSTIREHVRKMEACGLLQPPKNLAKLQQMSLNFLPPQSHPSLRTNTTPSLRATAKQSPNDCANDVSAPTAHCKGAEDCHVAIAPRNDGKIGGAQ